MNAKHLIPLAVLAAVSVAATAWSLRTNATTVASDRRGEAVIPSLATKGNDITGVSVRDSAGTIAIERRDNRFVAADSGYPIKMDPIRELVQSSAELAFEEARTADPNRYGDLDLADPGAKDAKGAGREITFRTAGGELADFVVGKTDTTSGSPAGGVFIRVKGEAQTFLARGDVRLPATRSEWFAPFDLDVKRKEVKKVELAGGGRDALTATASADKPGTLVLSDVPADRTAEDFKVSRLATVVESFTFRDVRKATKPADDARRMVVDAGNGLRLTFTSVGNVSDGWVQIAAEATEDAAKDKARLIASKVGGYDFRLPSNLSEVLSWTMADVTNEQKKDVTGEQKKDAVVEQKKDAAVEQKKDVIGEQKKDAVVEQKKDAVVEQKKDAVVEQKKDAVVEQKKDAAGEQTKDAAGGQTKKDEDKKD